MNIELTKEKKLDMAWDVYLTTKARFDKGTTNKKQLRRKTMQEKRQFQRYECSIKTDFDYYEGLTGFSLEKEKTMGQNPKSIRRPCRICRKAVPLGPIHCQELELLPC